VRYKTKFNPGIVYAPYIPIYFLPWYKRPFVYIYRKYKSIFGKKRREDMNKPKECLVDGSPVTPDHRVIDPLTGMQKDYVVLCPEERAKGFVRPVRRSYKHIKCGTITTMSLPLAETYARDPKFYSETFCCGCRTHFPLIEFTWEPDGEILGE